MKLITAVIQPTSFEKVTDALRAAGLPGVTVIEVKGHGTQAGRVEYYRGTAVQVDFRSKIRLELVVTDAQLESAIATIVDSAHTGQIGDGKVWVTNVEEVVRVRTGESGEAAL